MISSNMPDIDVSVVAVALSVSGLFLVLTVSWCLYSLFFYLRGVYHYQKHRERRAVKKKRRDQEEV